MANQTGERKEKGRRIVCVVEDGSNQKSAIKSTFGRIVLVGVVLILPPKKKGKRVLQLEICHSSVVWQEYALLFSGIFGRWILVTPGKGLSQTVRHTPKHTTHNIGCH